MGEEVGEVKMGEVAGEAKGGGLTAAKVKTAKPGKYHDGGGTGLFLRVDQNGGRFWIQRIVIHGKRREIGLGGFPVVGLAEARKAALANKQLAYSGGDPLAERRKAPSRPSAMARPSVVPMPVVIAVTTPMPPVSRLP